MELVRERTVIVELGTTTTAYDLTMLMQPSLAEDNLIHIDAITQQVFSTVLELSGSEPELRAIAPKDRHFLDDLAISLSRTSDCLQITRVIHDALPHLANVSSFLIIRTDGKDHVDEYLSGGLSAPPLRFRLKTKTKVPGDDPLLNDLKPGSGLQLYNRSELAASVWLHAQLKNSPITEDRQVAIAALRTGQDFNGLIIFFQGAETGAFVSLAPVLEGVAELVSTAFTCFRAVEKMKSMDCQQEVEQVRQEITVRDRDKSTLIEISNDMSAIRDKNTLISVLHQRLKQLFNFSHTLMSLTDPVSKTYTGLIFDSASISKRKHPDYQRICDARYMISDPVMSKVLASSTPVVFDLDELMEHADVPEWITMNHQSGIREMVVTHLNSGKKHLGAFMIFSEKKQSFLSKELGLIRAISSALGNAVDNILATEEIMEREREKTLLLSLSNDMAQIRNKEGLLRFNKEILKKVLPISHLLIFTMMDDERQYYPYLLDPDSVCRSHPEYEKITSSTIPLSDWIADKVFLSEHMEVFNLTELANTTTLPDYLRMNYECGKKEVIYNALSIGRKKTGLLVIFTDAADKMDKNQLRILQGVSSQLSTTVTNIIANEKIEKQFAEISEFKLQLENMNVYLQEEIQTNYNYSEIIGSSSEMNKIFHLVSQVADSQSSVLILGETGTGKELIARAIHNASSRKDKAMVKVNCAALPANLVESELFGHERGSFTGAIERRIGKFELANNSTLFLDEIGELPLDLQVKLLRALQEKEIERIGGKSVIKTNVRIIAATNRNLQKEVREGTFRSDLYFRLNIFPITLPPLRDRREDIPSLATHFLAKYKKKGSMESLHFSNKVMKELVAYNWPGNVRELEHVVERSVLLANSTTIKQSSLPVSTRQEMEEILPDTAIRTIEEVERDYIISILKRTNGKISGIGGAAELLKIPGSTLSSKMLKYNIKRSDIKQK
ncbi:sigma-54 interaction domain-containing protein [Mucilaginibacter sp. 22184]|uniref:sigma-54-dependent Fis family transcriptional regulator n=1 Tax=Mucilaginibacter sp. 22184 TaxID=3453887 RepID=UPI003F836481